MRNWHYFLPLALLLFISGCENKYKIEPGTDFYFLAKALALKFEALHPDSNFVLAKSRNYEVTANELLHVTQDNEGVMLAQWRNQNPVQVKEKTRLRAETLLVKKEILQRAQKLNITTTQAEIDSALQDEYTNAGKTEEAYFADLGKRKIQPETFKQDLLDKIVLRKYMEHTLADEIRVSDEELQAAFQKSRNISFRHILLDTAGKSEGEKRKIKKKLEGILNKIKKGADFSEMAREHSQDRASAESGGLYQDQIYGRLDSAFAAAAFATPVGEISDIAGSSFGYHIIKVIDRKNAAEAFEEVKPALTKQLKQQKLAAASGRFLENFKQEIGLEILK